MPLSQKYKTNFQRIVKQDDIVEEMRGNLDLMVLHDPKNKVWTYCPGDTKHIEDVLKFFEKKYPNFSPYVLYEGVVDYRLKTPVGRVLFRTLHGLVAEHRSIEEHMKLLDSVLLGRS